MAKTPKRFPSPKVNFDDPILAMKKDSYEDPFFVKTPDIKIPDTKIPPLDPNYTDDNLIDKP